MSLSSYRIPFLVPYFVEMQRKSFLNFLNTGLIYELSRKNPMYDSLKEFKIVFYPEYYQLSLPEYTAKTAILKFKTYASKLYVPLQLTNYKTKQLKLQWVMLGNLPLMTKRGHFIVNGSPRIIVNQIVRSPGIYYKQVTDLENRKKYYGDLISQRGAWLRLEIDKKERVWVQMKKIRKIPVLIFLKAIGITDIKLLESTKYFDFLEISRYETENIESEDYYHPETIEDCLLWIYGFVYPEKKKRGQVTLKKAKKFLFRKFFSHRTYDLSYSGRTQLNKKFNSYISRDTCVITPQDLLSAVDYLIKVQKGIGLVDDIDDLKNRRVRTSGELIQNQLGTGFIRLEKLIREKTQNSNLSITNIFSTRPLDGALREFFGSSPLSQFMDQTNPLAELTHKRRISSLGPGGVTRDTAGMDVRGIHPSHYGRICPIETPEGRNAGLVNSITTLSRINYQGFIETPFYNVYQGQMQKFGSVAFFSPAQEQHIIIAPSDLKTNYFHFLPASTIPVRTGGDFKKLLRNKIEYMSVSPIQMISIATSLIPFLEHDDANRALMGSNMQRQAVPLILPERPAIGTGLEARVVSDSGHGIQAKYSGFVHYISNKNILVTNFPGNSNTCLDISKNEVLNLRSKTLKSKLNIPKSKRLGFKFDELKTNIQQAPWYDTTDLNFKKRKFSILPKKPFRADSLKTSYKKPKNPVPRAYSPFGSDVSKLKSNESSLQESRLITSALKQNKHTHLFSRQINLPSTKKISLNSTRNFPPLPLRAVRKRFRAIGKKIVFQRSNPQGQGEKFLPPSQLKFNYIYENKYNTLNGIRRKQQKENNFIYVCDLINHKINKNMRSLNKNFNTYKWEGFTKSFFLKDVLSKEKKPCTQKVQLLRFLRAASLEKKSCDFYNKKFYKYTKQFGTPKEEISLSFKNQASSVLKQQGLNFFLNPYKQILQVSHLKHKKNFVFFKTYTKTGNLTNNNNLNFKFREIYISKTHVLNLSLNNNVNIQNLGLNIVKNNLNIKNAILNLNKSLTLTKPILNIKAKTSAALLQNIKNFSIKFLNEAVKLVFLQIFIKKKNLKHIFFYKSFNWQNFSSEKFVELRFFNTTKYSNFFKTFYFNNHAAAKQPKKSVFKNYYDKNVLKNYAIFKIKQEDLICKKSKPSFSVFESIKNIVLKKKYQVNKPSGCAAPWVFQTKDLLEPWVDHTKYALRSCNFQQVTDNVNNEKLLDSRRQSLKESKKSILPGLMSVTDKIDKNPTLKRFAIKSGFTFEKYNTNAGDLKQSNKNYYYVKYLQPKFSGLKTPLRAVGKKIVFQRSSPQGQGEKFLPPSQLKNEKFSHITHIHKNILKNKTLKKNTGKYISRNNKIISFKFKSKFNFLNNTTNYSLSPYQHSNQNTCIHQTPLVYEEEWIQKGDILADGSASVAGELALGKSILVAYMPWEGYNFEDAILINERLVYNDVYTSIHIEKYKIEISDTQYGLEQITDEIPNVTIEQISNLNKLGIIKLGTWVTQGDILVGKVTPILKRKMSGHEKLLAAILSTKKKTPTVRDTSLRVPKNVSGRVVHIEVLENENLSLEKNSQGPSRVHIYIAEKRKIQIGDKMSGRHGNKGIISNILPRQDMPYLADGTPIDMVLNPLGVPSRMNVGQIFECLLGLAAKELKEQFRIICFDEMSGPEASRSLTYSKLFEARLKTGKKWLFNPNSPGKMKLFDGRTGECFHQNVTVGQPYMLKLVHLVDEKIHARATGPYSLVTQQPLRGRSKHGGQRLGEMEVWALEGFGAAYTLQELLTTKSDDIRGRHQVMQAILEQKSVSVGTPESFKVLLSELQSLCLNIGIYSIDDSGVRKKVNIIY
jgi:DNA-directed RNA polymerase beta subunit